MQLGLAWLAQNQSQDDGKWSAWSLNKKRDPSSDIGHFITGDASASRRRCCRLLDLRMKFCLPPIE
jgi:hypothetical protein